MRLERKPNNPLKLKKTNFTVVKGVMKISPAMLFMFALITFNKVHAVYTYRIVHVYCKSDKPQPGAKLDSIIPIR